MGCESDHIWVAFGLPSHEFLQLNSKALASAVHGNNWEISCSGEDQAQVEFEYLWGAAALHYWRTKFCLAETVLFPVNGSQTHLQNPQQPTCEWSAFNCRATLGSLEWSQFSNWCEPSWASSGLAGEEQARVTVWLFLLVTDRKRAFLPFKDEISLTWDQQGWGSCGAEVWKNPLQI